MAWIGVWITAFGVEQQTPSVASIVETCLGRALHAGFIGFDRFRSM